MRARASAASVLYWSASDGLHKMPLAGGPDTRLGAADDRNVYRVEGNGTIQQGAIAAVPISKIAE